jgi:four helix bundle protein
MAPLMLSQVRAMSEQSERLKNRTIAFAADVVRLLGAIPSGQVTSVLTTQLAKSATSVGANYRATCNARSRQEFIARLGVVVEEADECVYWLQLLQQTTLGPPQRELDDVTREAIEVRAIFSTSLGTARANYRRGR